MKSIADGSAKWVIPIVCGALGLVGGATYQHALAVVSASDTKLRLDGLIITNLADHKELRLESREALERILLEQQRQGIALARMSERLGLNGPKDKP